MVENEHGDSSSSSNNNNNIGICMCVCVCGVVEPLSLSLSHQTHPHYDRVFYTNSASNNNHDRLKMWSRLQCGDEGT